MRDYLKEDLKALALSMFRKNFVGIYHGSISAKLDSNRFLINKTDAVFDDLCDKYLIELYYNKDYRWKEASIDANIHQQIYEHISDAKFISYCMPPYITAYTFNHTEIAPKDYFGAKAFGTISIYDPKQYEDWYDRASSEIYHQFLEKKTSILVIRGYGVYIYDRDMLQMVKRIAILENSCKLLMLAKGLNDEGKTLCSIDAAPVYY